MQKYALIREKRTLEIAKRMVRKNRRTFPPSIFQLNPIIGPLEPDISEPVDITPDIVEPVDIIPDIVVCISEANQPYEVEPIIEPILLIEKQTKLENVLIENSIEDPIEEIPDIINPTLIAQAEELRKLILLQETIKRFSKKKI